MTDKGHKGSPWLGWKLNSGHWSKVDKEKGRGKGRATQEAMAFNGKSTGTLGTFFKQHGNLPLAKNTS